MYFIKLGKKYINLDNVTTIEPKKDLGYVVHFVGQTHFRDISEADMVDIRCELEKIKTLQELDKIVLVDNESKSHKKSPCDDCNYRKFNKDGTWECIGTHVCMGKLNLDG